MRVISRKLNSFVVVVVVDVDVNVVVKKCVNYY